MMLMATGMALTMAPATESIMGSLPLAKAGVGSAVNDTTRQVGGALGVAIIGSVLSSIYGSHLADGLTRQSDPSPGARHHQGGLGARSRLRRVGRPDRRRPRGRREATFVDAFHVGLFVGRSPSRSLGAVSRCSSGCRPGHRREELERQHDEYTREWSGQRCPAVEEADAVSDAAARRPGTRGRATGGR